MCCLNVAFIGTRTPAVRNGTTERESQKGGHHSSPGPQSPLKQLLLGCRPELLVVFFSSNETRSNFAGGRLIALYHEIPWHHPPPKSLQREKVIDLISECQSLSFPVQGQVAERRMKSDSHIAPNGVDNLTSFTRKNTLGQYAE